MENGQKSTDRQTKKEKKRKISKKKKKKKERKKEKNSRKKIQDKIFFFGFSLFIFQSENENFSNALGFRIKGN